MVVCEFGIESTVLKIEDVPKDQDGDNQGEMKALVTILRFESLEREMELS